MPSLVAAGGYRAVVSPPLEPEEFEAFKAHPWIRELGKRISDDSALAQQALARIIQDLGAINQAYVKQHGSTAARRWSAWKGASSRPTAFCSSCSESAGEPPVGRR